MHKEKRRILAHDLGLHIEKLGHDGIDGWMMKPSEVIDQLMTLGLILEKLVKDDPIDESDKSEIRRILGLSIEDLFSKSAGQLIAIKLMTEVPTSYPLNDKMKHEAILFLSRLRKTDYDDEDLDDAINAANLGVIDLLGCPQDMLLDHLAELYPRYIKDIREASLRRIVSKAPERFSSEVEEAVRRAIGLPLK